jgi:hypothetical protein
VAEARADAEERIVQERAAKRRRLAECSSLGVGSAGVQPVDDAVVAADAAVAGTSPPVVAGNVPPVAAQARLDAQAGFIYVLTSNVLNEVKVGNSMDVSLRLRQAMTYNLHLCVEAVFFTLDRVGAEQEAFALLRAADIPRLMHVNACGTAARASEWFRARPDTILAHVRQAVHNTNAAALAHAGASQEAVTRAAAVMVAAPDCEGRAWSARTATSEGRTAALARTLGSSG